MPKQKKSTADAADALGISPQALGIWAKRPGAPIEEKKNGERQYLWPDFPRWRERELDRQARDEAKPEDAAAATLRYESARARKMEMEVQILEGRYIDVEEAAKPVEGMLAQLRSQLLTMPQKWAPAMVGLKTIPEAALKLDTAIGEALKALSEEAA